MKEHPFNEKVDKVFVINLDDSKERMKRMDGYMKECGIDFSRVAGVDGRRMTDEEVRKEVSVMGNVLCERTVIGCAMSHKRVWEKVLNEKLESAIICEDDIVFTDGYKEVFKEEFSKLKEKWDIFYLGSLGPCDENFSITNPISVILTLFRPESYLEREQPKFPLGLHCYAVSKAGCKKLLNMFKDIDYHLDLSIASKITEFEVKVCEPNIVYQISEDSTISKSKFPRTLSWMTERKDEKNIPYRYYLNVPVARQLTLFSIIVFVIGLVGNNVTDLVVGVFLMIEWTAEVTEDGNSIELIKMMMIHIIGRVIRKIGIVNRFVEIIG